MNSTLHSKALCMRETLNTHLQNKCREFWTVNAFGGRDYILFVSLYLVLHTKNVYEIFTGLMEVNRNEIRQFFRFLSVLSAEHGTWAGFPGGSEVKAYACNEEDLGSIPESGRSPGEGNGNSLQYSCLGNPMDGGAWWATVHGVAKSRTRLSDWSDLIW